MGLATQFPDIPDLYITDQLASRVDGEADLRGEMIAVQELAVLMASDPAALMPRFVDAAMQMVGGVAAGVSLLESEPAPQFRWRWVRGQFARFDGAPTPRNHSPCGVTLDRGEATLTRHPERAYDWVRDAGVVCPEVLLAPLRVRGADDLGTLWIVAPAEGHFTRQHARAITELSTFVAAALRMITAEQKLTAALEEQALLTQEMSHRTKNLFAVAEGMIRVTARDAKSVPDFAGALMGRLHALAGANALVHRDLDAPGRTARGAELSAVLVTVLKPHDPTGAAVSLNGPAVPVGDHAINGLALIFHELATNAAKYGALSTPAGAVRIAWRIDGDAVALDWIEQGGPAIAAAPAQTGFGSTLLDATVRRQFDGALDYHWKPDGLAAALRIRLSRLTG